jgi:hypothetical protein
MSTTADARANSSSIGAAYACAFLSFTGTTVLIFLVKPELIMAVVLIPAGVAALAIGAVTKSTARGYRLGAGAAVGGTFPAGVWVATHLGESAGSVAGLFGWHSWW